jgi:hypothetical protein
MVRKSRVCCFGLAVGICIIFASRSWAEDWSTEPFELRLWLAMSRAINSTDAIGREASVAYRSASSDNPAAADVRHVEPVSAQGFFCAGTHHIAFSDGAWIIAEDVNGFLRFNTTGTLAMGYVHFASQNGQTRQGFEDNIGNHEFLIKYGRQIRQNLYVGTGFTVNDMTFDYGDLFQGLPRSTHDHSISGSFTLGTLWQPKPNWTFGVIAGAGWTGSDVEGAVHLPSLFDVPFHADITTRTLNFKTGFGWRVTPALTVYSDAQYFRLDNNMNAVGAGRFYFGADVYLSSRISLMAGSSVDTNGHATGSSGLGINLMKPGRLKPTLFKLAYQYDPLPELSHEFGTGHLVSATMVFSF